MTRIEVLDKIRADLAWRGPGDKPLGNIVLPRADAEVLLVEIDADAILVVMTMLARRLGELMPEGERPPALSPEVTFSDEGYSPETISRLQGLINGEARVCIKSGCGEWQGDKLVRPALDLRGKFWCCPKCGDSYGEDVDGKFSPFDLDSVP